MLWSILSVIGIVILLIIIFLVICALFVNPKKIYEKDNKFYRWIAESVVSIVLKVCRVKIHIRGIQKVPGDTKVLFTGNHRSNFDPMVTWMVFAENSPAFISKESNFKIPVVGRIIRRCCFMPIDRDNPRNAIKTINLAADLLKRQEVSIGVYPEGTRSKNCELLGFHNGVFKIAQKADAPIVVLAIRGTEHIHKNAPFRKTEVYLDVAEVIPANDVNDMKTAEIGDRVRRALEYSLNQ